MSGTFVHATADVHSSVSIGEGTKIWNNVQIRENAVIGRECIVGKSVYIDHTVEIGDRVKIQNGVSIYHGVTIEDDVFLGPHMTFTNDLYPRAFDPEWHVVPTSVRRGASVGANVTVICGVELGAYSMAGAGAVVTRDVPPHALVLGNPARIAGFVSRMGRLVEEVGREGDEVLVRSPETGEELRIPLSHWERIDPERALTPRPPGQRKSPGGTPRSPGSAEPQSPGPAKPPRG